MTRAHHPQGAPQRGMALIIALILLMLMTLLAVSAFHIGAVQTVVVANAQQKARGVAAAQMAIDTVLSSTNFAVNPAAAIIATTCATCGTNTMSVSSNNDSVNDLTVTLTPAPTCVSAAPLPPSQLNITGPGSPNFGCLTGQQQGNWAVAGTTNAATLCAQAVWEINAQAVDNTTNTTVSVTQGVGEMVLTAQMSNFCPN